MRRRKIKFSLPILRLSFIQFCKTSKKCLSIDVDMAFYKFAAGIIDHIELVPFRLCDRHLAQGIDNLHPLFQL